MAERLKVAIVAPSLRILGGQAVQADRLLRAWRDDPDVEAWLVPHNPVLPQTLRWAERVKYVRTIATQLTYWPLLVRELARADVVHVFSASYWSFLLSPLPAIIVGSALRKPVLLNYRSGKASDHLQRSAVARFAIRHVDGLVVPSRFLLDVFAGHGVAASVVPNVVDLDRFRYRARPVVRANLVSTRNLEPLYNVACTLRAFRLVQDRFPSARLTLVGGGPDERQLRDLASQLRLMNVEFVGRVDPACIHEYYAAADIYVQTPNIDNMPTSVLEAFASGLPVVSTEAGGVPVIVAHGVHGLLAPLNDHERIAAHVVRLIEDPALTGRLTYAAYESCQRCTWSSIRTQWLDVYHGVRRQPLETAPVAGPLAS